MRPKVEIIIHQNSQSLVIITTLGFSIRAGKWRFWPAAAFEFTSTLVEKLTKTVDHYDKITAEVMFV